MRLSIQSVCSARRHCPPRTLTVPRVESAMMAYIRSPAMRFCPNRRPCTALLCHDLGNRTQSGTTARELFLRVRRSLSSTRYVRRSVDGEYPHQMAICNDRYEHEFPFFLIMHSSLPAYIGVRPEKWQVDREYPRQMATYYGRYEKSFPFFFGLLPFLSRIHRPETGEVAEKWRICAGKPGKNG